MYWVNDLKCLVTSGVLLKIGILLICYMVLLGPYDALARHQICFQEHQYGSNSCSPKLDLYYYSGRKHNSVSTNK